jgi:hypothetical protein
MSNLEQQVLEGGDQQNQQPQLAQVAHEGGAPPENIEAAVDASASSAVRPEEGVESALRTGQPAAPVAASPNLQEGVTGVAVSTFSFKSPFPAPTSSSKPSVMFPDKSSLPVCAPAPLHAPPPGNSSAKPELENVVLLPVSKMSAKDLAQIVAGEIHGFNTETWIAEDASGAAIIGFVAPSVLSTFLEHELKISSKFHRVRIQWIQRQVTCLNQGHSSPHWSELSSTHHRLVELRGP